MSEHHISKEHIGTSPFQYGISISNLANETNPQFALPDHTDDVLRMLGASNMGVEFQIESSDKMNLVLSSDERPAFVGVHLPIMNVDFLDPDKRAQSFEYGLRNIEFAEEVGADYVVIHMLSKNEWDHIGQRPEFIAEAKAQMEELVSQGKHTGYQGKYLFENLEFPLYPSTAAEVLDMQQWVQGLAERQGIQTGICLDLSHLWHTGIMIEINRHKGEVMNPYFKDPYAAGETDFISYVAPLAQEIAVDLDLIHITGTHVHQTHLQPQMTTSVRANDRIMLNLQQTMQHVSQALLQKQKQAFVINEAHNCTYEDMMNSVNSIRNFFAYGRT